MQLRARLAAVIAATALTLGPAEAQTMIDVTVDDGIDDPDVQAANVIADVDLVTTADLADQTGQLGIRIQPDDVDFATGEADSQDVSGLVTIRLRNANFSETFGAEVLSSSTGDSRLSDDCFAQVEDATVDSGGSSGDSSVTFAVPNIRNCAGEERENSLGSTVDEGVLQVTVPIALGMLADANLSVAVTASDDTSLANETFYEAPQAAGPLVEVLPRFRAEFAPTRGTDTDAAAARTLALDGNPPFSAFKADGLNLALDPYSIDERLTATLGRLDIEEAGTVVTLQGESASPAESIAVSVTAPKGAAGIEAAAVYPRPGFILEREEGTNRFSGTASENLSFPIRARVGVLLTGEASVREQQLVPEATVTVAESETEIAQAGDSELAPILRDGIVRKFFWVPLENGFVRRVFRLSGFDRGDPPRVLISVSGLNSDQPASPDIDLLANIDPPAGGEIVFSGQQIGEILQSRGDVDLSRAAVTRADVTVSIEAVAASVTLKSQVVSKGGSASPGGSLDHR